MASFLRSWLATLVIKALSRSIADDTLDTLITQGDGQVLKVGHRVHVMVALFDCLIDLALDEHVEILDLFGA
eukprot:11035445-Ditylum_brightwellii.AAC.1